MSGHNYTLEYRPVSELIDEVTLRLKKYNASSVIEPYLIIDAAWKCTYDLGLRIFKTYEDVLEIKNHRAKLPEAFYSLNFALLCGLSEVRQYPQISHHYEVIRVNEDDRRVYSEIDECGNVINCNFDQQPRKICTFCGDRKYELIQIVNNEAYFYRSFYPVRLKLRSGITKTCNGCPNLTTNSMYEIDIRDRWVYANIENGHLYINYDGYPMDEEGNMLIPNHPVLNDYYLYAALRIIIEVELLNSITDKNAANIIQLIESRYREAKGKANALVNMPNFKEMQNIRTLNRKKLYAKYYKFFY